MAVISAETDKFMFSSCYYIFTLAYQELLLSKNKLVGSYKRVNLTSFIHFKNGEEVKEIPEYSLNLKFQEAKLTHGHMISRNKTDSCNKISIRKMFSVIAVVNMTLQEESKSCI